MKRLPYLAALLVPVAAQAHGISPAIGGFYAGGTLVLIGPEDLLQWVALGVFAAVHPPGQAGWVAEALVVGLLAGFAAGSVGLVLSVPLWASVAALLAVGALLVAGACMPFAALASLALGIGLLHGAHAGVDMTVQPDKLAIAAGIGITAYVLMVVCIATFVWLPRRLTAVRVVAFRAFGSWVVAIALMLGAFELTGH
jgi:hydrogenase/urease accessory protein HupE